MYMYVEEDADVSHADVTSPSLRLAACEGLASGMRYPSPSRRRVVQRLDSSPLPPLP